MINKKQLILDEQCISILDTVIDIAVKNCPNSVKAVKDITPLLEAIDKAGDVLEVETDQPENT